MIKNHKNRLSLAKVIVKNKMSRFYGSVCMLFVSAYRPIYSVKAKFHYAILVVDRSEAGRRPSASWNLTYHLAR